MKGKLTEVGTAEHESMALAKHHGKRIRVRAVWDRIGDVDAERGQSVLVQRVRFAADDSDLISHAWIQQAETLAVCGARRGEEVEFLATVMDYRKYLPWVGPDCRGFEQRYGLNRPAKVELPERAEVKAAAHSAPEPTHPIATEAIPATPIAAVVKRATHAVAEAQPARGMATAVRRVRELGLDLGWDELAELVVELRE